MKKKNEMPKHKELLTSIVKENQMYVGAWVS